jgi:hypothetical protein
MRESYCAWAGTTSLLSLYMILGDVKVDCTEYPLDHTGTAVPWVSSAIPATRWRRSPNRRRSGRREPRREWAVLGSNQ